MLQEVACARALDAHVGLVREGEGLLLLCVDRTALAACCFTGVIWAAAARLPQGARLADVGVLLVLLLPLSGCLAVFLPGLSPLLQLATSAAAVTTTLPVSAALGEQASCCVDTGSGEMVLSVSSVSCDSDCDTQSSRHDCQGSKSMVRLQCSNRRVRHHRMTLYRCCDKPTVRHIDHTAHLLHHICC